MEQRGLPGIDKWELQVANALATGKETEDVAAALFIEPRTVRARMRRIQTKTGGRNSAHSLHILISNGLVHVEDTRESVKLDYGLLTILRDISDGLENRHIAEKQDLTLDQVKWYVRKIYMALQARNRVNAIYRGHQTGNLTPNNRRKTDG
jgi:DNA-binding NarL/FixJ family response regulator